LYHLKGELLLTQNDSDTAQAEYSFQSAMEIARKQGSRAWELREADRRDEARTMLADIYHWFTEGFDNVDFIDAKALLDELSG
jgi:hypothetical protein